MTTTPLDQSVGFIGFGMMGQALMGGCLRAGAIAKGKGWAADPFADFEKIAIVKEYEVNYTKSNIEAIKNSDIVFLALKPFLVEKAVAEFYEKGGDFKGKLVVSMISSFTLERLQKMIPDTKRIIRIMPNTAAMANASTTAICAPTSIDESDVQLVKKLMDSCGKSWLIPENRMNIWTAVAGCGPAYIFEILEAMADAAVVGGLPRDVANETVCQLMIGSAKMALESPKHFGELKDNVCSPNGATIAGVQKMRELGVQGSLMMTIDAARKRYDEVDRDPNA